MSIPPNRQAANPPLSQSRSCADEAEFHQEISTVHPPLPVSALTPILRSDGTSDENLQAWLSFEDVNVTQLSSRETSSSAESSHERVQKVANRSQLSRLEQRGSAEEPPPPKVRKSSSSSSSSSSSTYQTLASRELQLSGLCYVCRRLEQSQQSMSLDKICRIAIEIGVVLSNQDLSYVYSTYRSTPYTLSSSSSSSSSAVLSATQVWEDFKFDKMCQACRIQGHPQELVSLEKIEQIARDYNLAFSEEELSHIQRSYRRSLPSLPVAPLPPPPTAPTPPHLRPFQGLSALLVNLIKLDVDQGVDLDSSRLAAYARHLSVPYDKRFLSTVAVTHEKYINVAVMKVLRDELKATSSISVEKVQEVAMRFRAHLSLPRILALRALLPS